MTLYLAIIGSASNNNWTKNSFDKMITICIDFIKQSNHKNICLVSGGAAWSDHLAIYLYLNKDILDIHVNSLELYLPCSFNKKFFDNGKYHWAVNPGKTANTYHSNFSKKINRDSLKDIENAINNGAIIDISNGFHIRNKKIANKANKLIAFGENDEPTGGTKYTYDLTKCCKKYFKIV